MLRLPVCFLLHRAQIHSYTEKSKQEGSTQRVLLNNRSISFRPSPFCVFNRFVLATSVSYNGIDRNGRKAARHPLSKRDWGGLLAMVRWSAEEPSKLNPRSSDENRTNPSRVPSEWSRFISDHTGLGPEERSSCQPRRQKY